VFGYEIPRIVLARIRITNLVVRCLHFSTSVLEYFELKCSLVHLLVLYLTPFTVSSFQENSLHNMFDFVHSFRVTYFSSDEFVKEIIILWLCKYSCSWSMLRHWNLFQSYIIASAYVAVSFLSCCYFNIMSYMLEQLCAVTVCLYQNTEIIVNNVRTNGMQFINIKCWLVIKLL
jgi:hypothetical protein